MLRKSTTVTPIVLSEREAAQLISLSPSQLRRLRNEGKGPRSFWLTDRRLGYRVAEIEIWLANRPAA